MSYENGTYIDLRHLNKKADVSRTQKKSNLQEAAENLYEVGTTFVFNLTHGQTKAARRIPVVFA